MRRERTVSTCVVEGVGAARTASIARTPSKKKPKNPPLLSRREEEDPSSVEPPCSTLKYSIPRVGRASRTILRARASSIRPSSAVGARVAAGRRDATPSGFNATVGSAAIDATRKRYRVEHRGARVATRRDSRCCPILTATLTPPVRAIERATRERGKKTRRRFPRRTLWGRSNP